MRAAEQIVHCMFDCCNKTQGLEGNFGGFPFQLPSRIFWFICESQREFDTRKRLALPSSAVLFLQGEKLPSRLWDDESMSLLSEVEKLYAENLRNRVVQATEMGKREERSGFRKSKSCLKQFIVVKQLCEKKKHEKEGLPSIHGTRKDTKQIILQAKWQVLDTQEEKVEVLASRNIFHELSRSFA